LGYTASFAILHAKPNSFYIFLYRNSSNIHVSQIEPEKTNTNTENIELPNCGGTSELSQSLGTQVSIQKNVTVAATVITRAGVEAKIPLTAHAKLEAEIELAYEQSYTTVASRLDTIQTKAERESHVVYVIQWEEQKFVSTVSFVNNGDDYEVPYTYVLRVPKLKDSYRTPCPTSTAIVTVTNTLTPTVTSTNTPTLTSTSTPRPSDTPLATHTLLPTATQTSSPTATSTEAPMPPTNTPLPTVTNIPVPSPTNTPIPPTPIPPTSTPELVKCEGSDDLSLLPLAPPSGCVLIIEWYISTNEQCGILFTRDEPDIAAQAIGMWWYVYPNRPDSHLEEYKQKYPHCEVRDLR